MDINKKYTTLSLIIDTIFSKDFLKLIVCEIIVFVVLAVGINFGIDAYFDYKRETKVKVTSEELHNGVQTLTAMVEEELAQQKIAVKACVSVCKKHRAVYEAALAFNPANPKEYYNVVTPYTEAHPGEEVEIETAAELGFQFRGDADAIARFGAWLDGAEIDL